MNLDSIYELTPNAAELIAERRMTLIKWSVYDTLAAHPGALARSLAARLGMEPAALDTVLEEFLAANLIHEPELSRTEYLDRVKPKAEVPVAKEEITFAAVPAAKVALAPERKVSFTLRKNGSRAAVAPTPPPPSVVRAWLIKPLLDFVRERAGGGSLGQLAVYRTFLKVPQDLLKASKVEQLDLDSPDLQISDATLLNAIRNGAREVLGVPDDALPETPERLPALD